MVTRGWAGVGRRHRGPGCRRQEGQRAVSAEPFKSGASATGLARRRARDRRAARAAWRRHPRHCAGRGAIPYIHAGVGCARPTSTFFFFFWTGVAASLSHTCPGGRRGPASWETAYRKVVSVGACRAVPPGGKVAPRGGAGGGGGGPPFFFLTRGPIKQQCSSGPAVAMAARRM